jgi:hypothetical protein
MIAFDAMPWRCGPRYWSGKRSPRTRARSSDGAAATDCMYRDCRHAHAFNQQLGTLGSTYGVPTSVPEVAPSL